MEGAQRPDHPAPGYEDSLLKGVLTPLILFALLLSIVLGTVYWAHERQREAVVAEQRAELARVAELHAAMVWEWYNERVLDARTLLDMPLFHLVINRWFEAGPTPPLAAFMVEMLTPLLERPAYEGVALFSAAGEVDLILGAADARLLAPAFAEGLRAEAPILLPSLLPDEREAPLRLHLAVPVRNGEGVLTGLIGFQLDPHHTLLPGLENWPTPAASGETLLLAEVEGRPLVLNRLDPTTPVLAEDSAVAVQALRLERGLVGGLDYRSEQTVGVARPVPDTGWVVLAKVDRAELVAEVRRMGVLLGVIGGGAVLASGALLFLWWAMRRGRMRARWYEEALALQSLTDRFNYLTRHASDVMLLADRDGRIVDANQRAAELYGYPLKALLGRRMWELQRDRLPDDWLKSRDASRTESCHRRADGTPFPVEVSSRGVWLGRALFYQAIIRDIGERKEYERRIVRLRDLYAALSATNEAIVRLHRPAALLERVCRIAVEHGHFIGAWIGRLDTVAETVQPVAGYGTSLPVTPGEQFSYRAGTPGALGPSGTAAREGRVVTLNRLENPMSRDGSELARHGDIAAAASLPLVSDSGGVARGLMTLYAAERDFFDPPLIELLQRMAANVAYALGNFEREAERVRAASALGQSERRHRQLVENMSSGVALYQVAAGGDEIRIVSVNPAFERIEAIARDAAIGRRLEEVLPGASAAGLREAIQQAWRGGQKQHLGPRQYRDPRVAGWREYHVYRLDSGEVVVVTDDVTEAIETHHTLAENEQRLRLVLEGSSDGFWDYDIANDRIYFSPRAVAMLGYDETEISERRIGWELLVHPQDLGRVRQGIGHHLQGRTPQFDCELRMLSKLGEWRWILARGRVVDWDGAGHPLRIAGTSTDVTQRHRAEEQLRLWARVFEWSGDAIFITDTDRRIVSVNPAFTRITGYGGDELLGAPPPILRHQEPGVGDAIWQRIRERGFWRGELWDRRRGGEQYVAWVTLTAVRDSRDRIPHYIGIFSDISRRKADERRIQYMAHHDALTGLPNRMLLLDRLALALAHADRVNRRVAVLFIDLDRFKQINDTLGHHIGDELLVQTAHRVTGCVRVEDTVSRQGGDEFVIILSEVSRPSDAAHVAEKVVAKLSEPFTLSGNVEVRVTSSVGIALYPNDGGDANTLIKNADAAMYHAKERGRNNYQFFVPEINQRVHERIALENALRRALERGEFELHFQPKFAVADSRVSGVEALLRWRRNGGLLGPESFITVAEESGLLVPMGAWVLEEACRCARRWNHSEFAPLPVAINISAVQFRQRDFCQRLEAVIGATGASAEALEIELTETEVMQDPAGSTPLLNDMKAMGVRVALDHFGTGYSSLSYLRRFPLDRLKVDRSLIRGIATQKAERTITEAIIDLGKHLDLQVTAEGVETQTECELLKARHCDEVQGYFFSRPLPPEQLESWLRSRG